MKKFKSFISSISFGLLLTFCNFVLYEVDAISASNGVHLFTRYSINQMTVLSALTIQLIYEFVLLVRGLRDEDKIWCKVSVFRFALMFVIVVIMACVTLIYKE